MKYDSLLPIKGLLITSHWQNGGVSAIFNFCAFLSAECVPHSAFFINLASVETHRLRYCSIELSVQFSRHFANAFPVMGNGRATAQADTTDTKKDHAHPPPQII